MLVYVLNKHGKPLMPYKNKINKKPNMEIIRYERIFKSRDLYIGI